MPESRKNLKILGSFFALVVGLGYLAAVTNLYLSDNLADGVPGLSLRDVVVHFHGDRNETLLATKVRGSMRPHLESDAEVNQILTWIDAGAKEADFAPVKKIFDADCVACHNPQGFASFRPLTTYAEVGATTVVDTGITWHRLALLSHQHLFGIGLLCFALGLVILNTSYGDRFKIALIAYGYATMLLDIGG